MKMQYAFTWKLGRKRKRKREKERERENLDVCEGTERFEDGFLFWIRRR